MRGAEHGQAVLFSYVALEERIPADHPLRTLQALVEPVLAELSPRFDAIYEGDGRPSIPPSSCCVRSSSKCSTRSAANAS